VARLGGDEFAVLIEHEPAAARGIAERVARAFDDAADITADDLFTRADLAMFFGYFRRID
jgi:GGDEF domain-containing protein